MQTSPGFLMEAARMNAHAPDSRADAITKINELIHGMRVAMLTSMNELGHLHARPMGTQDTAFDGTLWFFTQRSTEKVEELLRHPDVNVSFSDPDRQRYVSISGRAVIVNDREKMRELWSPMLKAWFPDGLDDPELTLIQVDALSAEYWDTPSGKIVALAGLAKALITGQPANDIGENERVDL